MQRFLAVVAVLIVLIFAGLYAAGWMTFQSDEQKATVEIKTGEIKSAAEDAGEKAKKIVEDAAETIREPAPATSESP
ncbi:MAG: hypothetical protein L0211_14300 [Planctomycetaceae bacterium]|nr:hypothetical protein [Planctomycetaceae bacterium]